MRGLVVSGVLVGASACTLVGGFGEDRVAADDAGATSVGSGAASSSSGSTTTTSPASSGVTSGGAGGDTASSGVTTGGAGPGGGGDGGREGTGGDPGSGGSTASSGGEGGAAPPDPMWPDSATVFCTDGTVALDPCPAPGEELHGQDGTRVTPGPAYEFDGQVAIETKTGLAWSRVEVASARTWVGARDHCANLVLGELTDWRLPTLREMVTLIDAGTDGLPTDVNAFSNVKTDYWLADAFSTSRMILEFDAGTPGVDRQATSAARWARCVHGPPLLPLYVDGTNVTSDMSTELTWERNAPVDARTWIDALAYCEALELDGYDDFRLPSFKELLTIVDVAKATAIDLTHFPGAVETQIWTSTPMRLDPARAQIFDFGVMRAEAVATTTLHPARCVR